MALTQPLLYSVNAFDATKEFVFQFEVVGGDQVTGSKLTIKDNATLAVVYEGTVSSFRFSFALPANTLTNGQVYQAFIQTANAAGDMSVASNSIQFYCFSTPSLVFNNIPISGIIENASYQFDASYTQAEGETLNAYVFNLYDNIGTIVSTSGTMYNVQSSLPTIISYLFNGFSDNTVYEIEVVGTTTHGMQVSTGRVEFTTAYKQSNIFSFMFLTNNCQRGYITIQSNVVGISGVTNPENPTYIDNEEIDLREDGAFVEWSEGYTLPDNYTMRLWGRDFTPNSDIFTFRNESGDTVTLRYCTSATQCWIEMRAVMHDWIYGYTIRSEIIALPDSTEQLCVWLRCVDNIYELKLENRGLTA